MTSKKSKLLVIYALTFTSFLMGTLQFVFSGILDQVSASIGVSVSVAGQLITAFSLGGAIGSPILIILLARFNLKRQLLIALSIVLLTTITTVLWPVFGMMMVSRTVLGIGFGVYVVVSFRIVAGIAEEGKLARTTANLALGFGIAMVVGVPSARVIATAYSWTLIFWAIGLLVLILLITFSRILPDVDSHENVPLKEQLMVLKQPRIIIALTVTLLNFTAFSVMNTYTAPYLTGHWLMHDEKVSMMLFIFGIFSMVGSKLGGYLADFFSPGRTLIVGMSLQAVTLTLVLISPAVEVLVMGLLILWALTAWTCGPILGVNLLTIAPAAASIILSLNSTFIQLGFASGAGIGGAAIEMTSISSIIVIGAVSVGMAGLLGALSFGRSSTAVRTSVHS